jgi:DNA adenine methylase
VNATIAPFAWYGGKSRMASTIVGLLPPHRTYIEPFGGAAAVLCSKRPAVLDVYNDVNGGLVSFFRALREHPDELERALRLTPYSRAEFAEACRTWESIEDDVERARRWYVRCRQAFASSAATVGWGFEVDGAARGGTRARSFATAVDNLERFAERFRRVQIDQLDWRDCLARYDKPAACFYLDPPYHPDTRGRGRHSTYVDELTAADHEDLVAAAIALRGSVLISGYEHESYTLLEGGGASRESSSLTTRRPRARRRAGVPGRRSSGVAWRPGCMT